MYYIIFLNQLVMFGDIELTATQTETGASTDTRSSSCPSIQFFPVRSKFYPIKKCIALAKKIAGFIEYLMDEAYFEHYMDDVLQTDFCEVSNRSSVCTVSYILDLIELMDDGYVIENILVEMLIYLDRYLRTQGDWLHRLNMKALVLCATSLAVDMLEDSSVKNKKFVKFSGMTGEGLHDLQLKFLEGLDWCGYIDEEAHRAACKVLDAFQPAGPVEDEEDGLKGLAFI